MIGIHAVLVADMTSTKENMSLTDMVKGGDADKFFSLEVKVLLSPLCQVQLCAITIVFAGPDTHIPCMRVFNMPVLCPVLYVVLLGYSRGCHEIADCNTTLRPQFCLIIPQQPMLNSKISSILVKP
jgi:hypothetical protein